MGLRSSRQFLSSEVPVYLLVLGLDAAGKTTLLYRLCLSEVTSAIPTIGFSIESTTGRNLTLVAWDSVYYSPRSAAETYYRQSTAVVFMVDSCDVERLEGAREMLESLLEEQKLAGKPLLVLANKQDREEARNTKEISRKLGLQAVRGRNWKLFPTAAITGEGLEEAFAWLIRILTRKANRHSVTALKNSVPA